MGFAINHNVASVQALGNLDATTGAINKSLAKLSTGLRIVQAGDDASGLVISERMRQQISGLQTDKLNAQEGINMLSTAEGALNEVSSIMQRLNTLAVRAANDVTLGTVEAGQMDNEKDALVAEVDRIAGYVQFNGKTLFGGAVNGNLQLGPNSGGNNQLAVSIGTMTSTILGINALDLTSGTTASAAITSITSGLDTLSATRGDLGTIQNRVEHTINNINVMIQNTTAAESSIRDADMAMEISSFTRLQILQQAGTSMLAQANAQPQQVLSLLKG
jgi:flagellin